MPVGPKRPPFNGLADEEEGEEEAEVESDEEEDGDAAEEAEGTEEDDADDAEAEEEEEEEEEEDSECTGSGGLTGKPFKLIEASKALSGSTSTSPDPFSLVSELAEVFLLIERLAPERFHGFSAFSPFSLIR